MQQDRPEIWKEIPGFNGWYEASNLGRIRSYRSKCKSDKRINKPKIIKGNKHPLGYIRVKLKNNSSRTGYLIHRLVAETFIPNPQKKPQINHKNGIKDDNRVSNLEWVTPQENVDHAIDNGFIDHSKQYGEKGNNAQLTKKQVLQIRSVYDQGWATQTELSKAYNISQKHVSRIVNKQRWKHI